MHRSLVALALPIGAMLIATACTGGAPPSDGRASGGPQVLVASADPSATEAAPTPLTTPAPSPEPTFALPSPTPAPEPLPSGLA
ncbi:MAG TPA: hypothetical protein VES19_06210, partial [Candidatus Limnocylindrales bacterium]|nr:hypothetical protein [Candidatus Limnocylindrales bacterium]